MEISLKTLLFVYNPKSGRGVIGAHLAEVIKAFETAGYIPTIYRTRTAHDLPYVAEHYAPLYDHVVCAGGDGTLNGLISGLMNVKPEDRPTVGFIPTGSTNDTRNSYKLPLNIARAASISVNGVPFETDIGKLNDRYFAYVASFGELSAVSAFTPQSAKNVFGYGAYLTGGIKALLKMNAQYVKVTIDEDKTVEGEFFLGMVTNALSVGGIAGITGKTVDLQDGLHELMLFKKPADLIQLNEEVAAVLSPDSDAGGLITRVKASHIIFESDEELQWVVDGEDAGKCKYAEINNLNRAIRIMSRLKTEEKNTDTENERESSSVKKELFSWLRVIVIAVAVALILNCFVIINSVVPSSSMESTIMTGSRMFGFRLAYLFDSPKQGDIVIFRFPDNEKETFVKRVIGCPGDVVEIKAGLTYVNGEAIEEPYLNEKPQKLDFGPYEVPKDSYFVMGDNRDNSKDARYWNNTYVSRKEILAKAVICYWPLSDFGILK